ALQGELFSALAEVYYGLNLPSEGRSMFARALETRRRALGPEHPDTLKSMTALSIAMGLTPGHTPDEMVRSKAEGAKLAHEALSTQQRVLGPEHPDTLQSMMVVGNIFRSQGNLAGAEAFQRQTLAARRRVLGSEHVDTVWSIFSLSETLELEGQLA